VDLLRFNESLQPGVFCPKITLLVLFSIPQKILICCFYFQAPSAMLLQAEVQNRVCLTALPFHYLFPPSLIILATMCSITIIYCSMQIISSARLATYHALTDTEIFSSPSFKDASNTCSLINFILKLQNILPSSCTLSLGMLLFMGTLVSNGFQTQAPFLTPLFCARQTNCEVIPRAENQILLSSIPVGIRSHFLNKLWFAVRRRGRLYGLCFSDPYSDNFLNLGLRVPSL
jgi:hypothetical protein